MKKPILNLVILTILAGIFGHSLQATESLFRPAFNRKLKRLAPVKLPYLKERIQHKKSVYIDLQQIYWGDLEELTSSDCEESDPYLNQITQRLQESLGAFSREFKVKILWRKEDNDTPGFHDVTQDFIDYLDKHTELEASTLTNKDKEGC